MGCFAIVMEYFPNKFFSVAHLCHSNKSSHFYRVSTLFLYTSDIYNKSLFRGIKVFQPILFIRRNRPA